MGFASLGTMGFALATARRLDLPYAEWVPWALLLQPLFFVGGFTALTESAVALYLSAAIWAFVSGRLRLAAALISLVAVTRYEAVVLLPVFGVALALRRAPLSSYPLLVWAPVLHNLVGRWLLGDWPFAIFLAPRPTTHYGAGTPLTMLVRALVAWGPAIGLAAGAGALCVRRLWTRVSWVIPAAFGSYLLAHVAIYWRGAYASGGYPRFLVSVAPAAALLAIGLVGEVARSRRRSALLALLGVTGLAVLGAWLELAVLPVRMSELVEPARNVGLIVVGLLCLMVAAAWGAPVRGKRALALLLGVLTIAAFVPVLRPLRLGGLERDLADACAWVQEHHPEAPVVAANTWACYFLDQSVVPANRPDFLDHQPAGTIFIWDDGYAVVSRFGATLPSMRGRAEWHEVFATPARSEQAPAARVFVRMP
jgi:hypothetical protein